jgi:hypothetical protein
MTTDLYVFKIRLVSDRRPWEQIAPQARFKATPDEARAVAAGLAGCPAVVEVRFNSDGSQQGYYVAGSTETRSLHRQLA